MGFGRMLACHLLCVVGLFSLAAVAQAAPQTYTYEGNNFTTVTPPPIGGAFTTADRVTVSITVSEPFLPNSVDLDLSPVVIAFSLFDGVTTIDQNNATVVLGSVSTNSVGEITEWAIDVRDAADSQIRT